MSGAEVGACSGCQPCQDCGQHVPKARIPALCEACTARRPDTPAWIHAGEWRITLADARAARDEVADELARHTDTLSYTRDDDTVRLGCRCGHERGTTTKAALASDLDGRMRAYRLHVADAVLAVLDGVITDEENI